MIKLSYCKLFVAHAHSGVMVDNCTKGDVAFLFKVMRINAPQSLEHIAQYIMYGYSLELLAN